jgi:hypothetical protein
MTAHLYCWTPSLGLNPTDVTFSERIRAIHRHPLPPRSPRLVDFVNDLLARYADLTETDDTVWGDGPLVGNIIGDFINMSLVWSRYEEAAPFIVETAKRHGLHCFDPQTGKFFPSQIQ